MCSSNMEDETKETHPSSPSRRHHSHRQHHHRSSGELDSKTREKMLANEMRSFKTRGFHDGYDEGKNTVIQDAFDAGYQRAFEQNFILSTLKGVAHALKTSYNHKCSHVTIGGGASGTSSGASSNRNSSDLSATNIIETTNTSFSSSSRRRHRQPSATRGDTSCSSSSSNVSNTTGRSSNINANISSNHLLILESMKFDDSGDIESIKSDLIKICRENRLEILAHYVSQIG